MDNNNICILLIEDDKYILNFITVSLKSNGYRFFTAGNGAGGLALLQANNPDLVLLDLGLPDMDGIEVIRRIRQLSEIPVMIISARGQEQDKITALDAGADDYITKPFSMGELLARIRVFERKRKKEQSMGNSEEFVCDYLTVNYEKGRVFADGAEVHLTPIEYKLLVLLIANRGKVLTHNTISKEVWGYGETGEPQSIRVYMASLRRKIEKNSAQPRFIITKVGVGYRFADE
ncbi:MAG: response regulator transcription factor [Bacillota bacterium]|nr:response regulator transcription factor [Bacillota bacterium]